MINGIIIINKEKEYTSNDVVRIVKKIMIIIVIMLFFGVLFLYNGERMCKNERGIVG